jgi:hypothetical protein
LQGWAILENASGQDWRDVQVTLIGGSPRGPVGNFVCERA